MTKGKDKEVSLKSYWKLLARLVIIGRAHKIDVKNMMSYCLGPLPLAIASHDGCLVNTKAKLLLYLESALEASPKVETPTGSVWIVDGMAVLQQMSPKYMPQNIGQLDDENLHQLLNFACTRGPTVGHFVMDRYPAVSMKNAERKEGVASGSKKINIEKPDQTNPKTV